VCEQEENVWNQDTPYFWRFALPGSGVPPEAEELAAGYYEKQDYPHAKAAFELLTELFDGYAEGHNYLGLIALEEGRLDEAVASFEKTIELGRKLFPKRISKKRFWSDDATRPYMRGLMNLALALNRADRFDEALALCDRLENECGDEVTASWHRATICLNLGRWSQAASSAGGIVGLDAEASFLQAFALHASGERQTAVAAFLHAALNHPRTARMLLALRTSREPRGYDEISDHNAGVNLIRALHAYLARPPRGFRRFFTALVADPRVAKLLDEVRDAAHRFRENRKGGDRSALERMNQMRSRAFAEAETHRLRDFFDGSLPAAMEARP
jgi:tetratricopeptide (TPR) repeat protein